MKKILPLLLLLFTIALKNKAQTNILTVPTVVQQQDQWCWAGCTNSILTYFGLNVSQCQIAEYNRSVATWHSFGTTNCCTNATQGCNYWNYNWGSNGSMEDILLHIGNIYDVPTASSLAFNTIKTEIDQFRPFIIRWGWTSGGGHFIVGKGYNSSNQSVYYMNPWPGEGAKIATHTWMINDGNHSWTHTNVLSTSPQDITAIKNNTLENEDISIFPNPASNKIFIQTKKNLLNSIQLIDAMSKVVYQSNNNVEYINLEELSISKGIYFLKLSSGNFTSYKKIVIE